MTVAAELTATVRSVEEARVDRVAQARERLQVLLDEVNEERERTQAQTRLLDARLMEALATLDGVLEAQDAVVSEPEEGAVTRLFRQGVEERLAAARGSNGHAETAVVEAPDEVERERPRGMRAQVALGKPDVDSYRKKSAQHAAERVRRAERIVNVMREHEQPIAMGPLVRALGLSTAQIEPALGELLHAGTVRKMGVRAGTRYGLTALMDAQSAAIDGTRQGSDGYARVKGSSQTRLRRQIEHHLRGEAKLTGAVETALAEMFEARREDVALITGSLLMEEQVTLDTEGVYRWQRKPE